ncbi:hypothetical protein TIFTF001_045363 [Ficus carica]|uniref:Ribosomal eL28/Mak16 domain-containing protein n=1 Tax=Ficus carica TaxID=3494 RepID=A0AA87YR33_FICCA|nr:hypothetical protein TIFTF001_045363 [Ficus carica]
MSSFAMVTVAWGPLRWGWQLRVLHNGDNGSESFAMATATGMMATVPGQLIWEIVKKNNSFLVNEFGNGTAGVRFSKEPNNLYNLNSYKYSGMFLSSNASLRFLPLSVWFPGIVLLWKSVHFLYFFFVGKDWN